MPSALPVSPSEIMTSENSGDNLLFGPSSGYFVHFGSYGGNLYGNPGFSPLTSPAAYPQPMGVLGSYEQNAGQISQQQRLFNTFGLTSSSSPGSYPHSATQSPYFGSNDRFRFAADKGRRRERDHDSMCISNESPAIDRNRGPRASLIKGETTERSLSSGNSKNNSSGSRFNFESYNLFDFATDYENAKFFIIKSFREDNVHKSIKYNVWAITPHGNKKLDAAYREAKESDVSCPVFQLFSVKLELGVEMSRILKDHDARTSILDDFDFYDERERSLNERRARQQASRTKGAANLLADDSINQISDSLAQNLQLKDSGKETPASNIVAVSRTDVPGSLANDSINTISDSFSEATQNIRVTKKVRYQQLNQVAKIRIEPDDKT